MNADLAALAPLGFTPHFARQIDAETHDGLTPVRVSEVQRSVLKAIGADGPLTIRTPSSRQTNEYGVGDWVMVDHSGQIFHTLERQTVLTRRAAGTDVTEQIIAANIDTLFIVSSCNADFNLGRLERYLALAAEAEVTPVLILTKADLADDAADYERKAQTLLAHLPVLAINAKDRDDQQLVEQWIGRAQTAALVGSSGVGKTTLLNALTGASDLTQGIREDDAKGRHTTTSRSLHPTGGGGWVIDTPGMRALRLHEKQAGVETVFADIQALAATCKFNNCSHETEPGCAVTTAIQNGDLAAERLDRWRKLLAEDNRNTETIAQSRRRSRDFTKMVNRTQAESRTRKGNRRGR